MTGGGRVALVTGAGGGIGGAIAVRLASLGHRVALLDQNLDSANAVASEVRSAGGHVAVVGADVGQPDAVDAAVGQVHDELGRVEILVNAAGYASDATLTEMTLQQWDSVVTTHLRGSWLTIRAVAPGMRRHRWGRIVNISSISALGDDERANYVSAKAGVEGLTRAAARDLGAFGITANTVGPGVIHTAMTSITAARAGRTLAEHLAHQAKAILVGRVGQPADVARAVQFFVADDADFVTGQTLYVSGDTHR